MSNLALGFHIFGKGVSALGLLKHNIVNQACVSRRHIHRCIAEGAKLICISTALLTCLRYAGFMRVNAPSEAQAQHDHCVFCLQASCTSMHC